jgi:DNA-binding NarL/FixJ family response regulator
MKDTFVRLMYIEDHPVMVHGFRDLFRSGRDSVRLSLGFSGIREAMENAHPDQFDLIILDLFLDDEDPISNIETISRHFPGKPIIIYTSHNSIGLMKAAFRAGVRAWVQKSAGKPEIKEVVNRIFRGETIYPQELLKYRLELQKNSLSTPIPAQKFYPDKEQHTLMQFLCEGLTIKEIATKHFHISVSAVEKKLQFMREATEAKTNYELVAYYLRECVKE